jgi:hypothetical protein
MVPQEVTEGSIITQTHCARSVESEFGDGWYQVMLGVIAINVERQQSRARLGRIVHGWDREPTSGLH